MDFIFKVVVKESRTRPSLISWLESFTYLCQSKRLWTVQVTSQVVTRSMIIFFAGSLFDTINDLET